MSFILPYVCTALPKGAIDVRAVDAASTTKSIAFAPFALSVVAL